MKQIKLIAITALLIATFLPAAMAEVIQVRVLNAKNEKPVANEKVNINIKGVIGDRTYVTNSEGIFHLQIDPTASLFAGTEWWVTCRNTKADQHEPYVLAQDIIKYGVTLQNTCGHAKSETIKGQLTIFARKASLIENFQR
jgi:hypothetical protein